MPSVSELLERESKKVDLELGHFERLLRRRDRKRRNQRIGAGALAIIIALVSFAALARAFSGAERPADAPKPKPQGIFSEVHGWIAFGLQDGIWAVNPTPGSMPTDRIQLSERAGEPLAWSSDGSKLLISRQVTDGTPDPTPDGDLFILNANGAETRLTWDDADPTGSFSPDGSKVVYDATTYPANRKEWRSRIYVVEADGGSRRLLLASGLRKYADGNFHTALFNPVFSPDGAQIAYFDGMGDWGNTLRVMNADGSGVRVLSDQEFGHVYHLAWSPDGSRLAFSEKYGGAVWIVGVDGAGLTEVPNTIPYPTGNLDELEGAAPRWSPTGSRLAFQSAGGIWVINGDGSGLRQVAPDGTNPVWSPDGSRIAYEPTPGSLETVRWNGSDVQRIGVAGSGPWNPLPP
jgi:Tol biopolymer transport system component